MTSGGARYKSGPQKDPGSGRSERAGFKLTSLPRSYDGPVPPLEPYLPNPTGRHREVWIRLWRTAQANAWVREEWRWPVVADLVRYTVAGEQPKAPVTLSSAKRQLRDDLGLSPQGLIANGWAISVDELEPRRGAGGAEPAEDEDDPRSRFGVVAGGD